MDTKGAQKIKEGQREVDRLVFLESTRVIIKHMEYHLRARLDWYLDSGISPETAVTHALDSILGLYCEKKWNAESGKESRETAGRSFP